ncbi:MAG: heat-inducible transcription repressor HrcA [Clostridiales bacterium]|nr:heat-inducible transcription repressor HrcA [Clostridiales bacterium]
MLNTRQLQILKLIIDDFIDSGLPVGSRTISKKSSLGISSATVRNEMADLEELGYLYQPHTSAGRIPSDLGYRLYVENLLDDRLINSESRILIRSLLVSGKISAGEVIEKAVHLLTQLTGLTVVSSFPGFRKRTLNNLKLIKISDAKVLLILVSDNEIVKNITLPFSGTSQDILDLISNSLLSTLKGSTIEDIDVKKISRLKYDLRQFESVIDYLVPILRDSLKNIEEIEYHVEGVENILSIPEFSDSEKVRKIYKLFEDKTIFKVLFNNIEDEGIYIKIGDENELLELNECSVITTAYRYKNNELGKIAVIGSKRMDYRGIISVVEYTKNTLTDIFSGIYL